MVEIRDARMRSPSDLRDECRMGPGRSGAFVLAVPVTQVRNVESTASVASSPIDADCRRDWSSTVSVTAASIASLVTG